MYSNRLGGFRNSKPRIAKPSSTVVSRFFSWFTINDRAANWRWRSSHLCLTSDSVRASNTILSRVTNGHDRMTDGALTVTPPTIYFVKDGVGKQRRDDSPNAK